MLGEAEEDQESKGAWKLRAADVSRELEWLTALNEMENNEKREWRVPSSLSTVCATVWGKHGWQCIEHCLEQTVKKVHHWQTFKNGEVGKDKCKVKEGCCSKVQNTRVCFYPCGNNPTEEGKEIICLWLLMFEGPHESPLTPGPLFLGAACQEDPDLI